MLVKKFLSKNKFKAIKDHMIHNGMFPWFFNETVVDAPPNVDKYFQFTHTFYDNGKWNSNEAPLLDPIIQKIKPLALVRIKANLQTRSNEIIEHGFHTDFQSNQSNITTAIFYINTCNGYTLFEDGTKILSEENKWYEFDSKKNHTGSSCTDEKCRVVINFNYIKSDNKLDYVTE
tara:strand:- start:877 stop:1401 length:525 start_codon:yes stop_codon:yes gene_type:complete